MTSKELVSRAIHFRGPARLPFTSSMGETAYNGDTVAIFPDVGVAWWLGGGGVDEWGCRWEVAPGAKDMGQVKNVVVERLEEYAEIKIPDASRPSRYRHWDGILRRAEAEEKYVTACNGPLLFERMHFLHGFENTLTAVLLEPELTGRFLRRIAEYHFRTVEYIREHFRGRVHGYRGTDDWGSQAAPLISPAAFRAVFKPVYADIFRAVHEAGMDAWMHSCGQILPLLDDLIDAGLDVVNLMQPNVLPIPALEAFKGRVCFEICADMQNTLLSGTERRVRGEVRAILRHAAHEKGGLIEYQPDVMLFEGDGVSRELACACHDEYRRADPYARRPDGPGGRA